jgi:hypothetical protein
VRIGKGLRIGQLSAKLLLLVLFHGCHVLSFAQVNDSKVTAIQKSYKYDQAGIRLRGKLRERRVYGPPGYGETPKEDSRNTIFVLSLSQAITVGPLSDAVGKKTGNLDVARDVREVQLFVDRSRLAETRKLVGKVIMAAGTLNEAIAPSVYTKVWLDVKNINSD